MKIRDSGMPEQAYWESLFDADDVIDAFGWTNQSSPTVNHAIEFGCGYGTFTNRLAQCFAGRLDALDMESDMIRATQSRLANHPVNHVHLHELDFVDLQLPPETRNADVAVLFHIMHLTDPLSFLRKIANHIRPGGSIAILHWRSDQPTPRGPAVDLRPTPQQIFAWAAALGANFPRTTILTRCPHHHAFEIILP